MPSSPGSSPASAPFRLEWRPSRWPLLALLILGPLAAACVLLSAIPPLPGRLLALAAFAWGLWQARAHARRARRELVIDAQGTAFLDGEAAQAWMIRWRGPLAVVQLVDHGGRRQDLAWWPDTLPPPARRELRLAAARDHASLHTRAMAP
ncbi:hypothetical protein Psesu_1311 [Pseudoxanthomonas suwonensis 11-1]|uniref:Toxin CptA n=1 Tax=Pseudoxanthomonas suwonensis (strain 11-1) TaxID=743721 RepID=E6WT02_PSEUU|nr:protein YgfX [Pseudoxanthomonas suwonensis]ADV27158.1 hypothetical protein Psesu_1311 [Pseudoxanthomonas suwonensis 11-1]